MKLKFSFLIIFIFLLIRLQAQQFSGTITNPLADPVQNARVILQYPNGDPENDTVYSDASGYYIIGHTVGINQIIRGKESLSYMYDVNILTVNIISEKSTFNRKDHRHRRKTDFGIPVTQNLLKHLHRRNRFKCNFRNNHFFGLFSFLQNTFIKCTDAIHVAS
jgi:hypothetical protein